MRLITDVTKSKLKMLVYGRGGTGKTKLTGSAAMHPDTSPALHLSIGGNPRSLRLYPRQPVVVEITEMKDFNDLYTFLANGQEEKHPLWEPLGVKVNGPFKSLTIDGGSVVQQKVWALITGHQSKGFHDVPGMNDPSDFRKNLDMMTEWASLFFGLADRDNKLPIHVFLTALERDPAVDFRGRDARAEGQKGPSVFAQTFRPLFLGQAIALIESLAEVAVRMVPVERLEPEDYKEIGSQRLQAKGHWNVGLFAQGPDYFAKDQTLKLGEFMYDPTIEKMWEKIYGTQPIPTQP